MIDEKDKQTIDLYGKKRRGRPVTGNALSGADRVRKHRAGRKARVDWISLLERPTEASSGDLAAWLLSELSNPSCSIETFQACLCELETRRLQL